jgi:hypothetical protein
MDQNETLPSPFDLPPVGGETGEQSEVVKQEGAERNPEFLPPVTPGANAASQPAPHKDEPSTVAQSVASPVPPASPVPSPSLTTPAPQIADDIDLIEKEWVEKAKEIVDKTKENPYLQNKAISEIKADYIKKRYNKELAKSEE